MSASGTTGRGARKDRLVSGRTRPWHESHPVLLACGHRHYMAEQDIASSPKFAFCMRCQDVRNFARRKPSNRRWTGHI